MILVRTTIQGKFGTGGELAKAMAAATQTISRDVPGASSFRVLTDLSGGFDRVILEVTTDSLATWEQARVVILSHPSFHQLMASTYDMSAGGSTDFFTIEAAW